MITRLSSVSIIGLPVAKLTTSWCSPIPSARRFWRGFVAAKSKLDCTVQRVARSWQTT
jgi:hypothetical protein